jgi:hypothetical protein
MNQNGVKRALISRVSPRTTFRNVQNYIYKHYRSTFYRFRYAWVIQLEITLFGSSVVSLGARYGVIRLKPAVSERNRTEASVSFSRVGEPRNNEIRGAGRKQRSSR